MSELELRGAIALLCEICDNEKFDYELAGGEWTQVVSIETIRKAVKRIKDASSLCDR